MLSIKDLVFKDFSSYTINKVVSTNVVKLQLPTLIRIHLVVNISHIIQYKEQVGEQKVRGGKASRSKRSQRVGGREILNKEENKRSSEVLGMIEEVYSRA